MWMDGSLESTWLADRLVGWLSGSRSLCLSRSLSTHDSYWCVKKTRPERFLFHYYHWKENWKRVCKSSVHTIRSYIQSLFHGISRWMVHFRTYFRDKFSSSICSEAIGSCFLKKEDHFKCIIYINNIKYKYIYV